MTLDVGYTAVGSHHQQLELHTKTHQIERVTGDLIQNHKSSESMYANVHNIYGKLFVLDICNNKQSRGFQSIFETFGVKERDERKREREKRENPHYFTPAGKKFNFCF